MEYHTPDQIQKRLAQAQRQASARQLDLARSFVKSAPQRRDAVRERQRNERLCADLARDATEIAIAPSLPAPRPGGFSAACAPWRPAQRWPAPGGVACPPPGRVNPKDEARPAIRSTWWKRMFALFRILVSRFRDDGRHRARQSQARAAASSTRRRKRCVR